MPQELYVQFEHKDILNREDKRRRGKGLEVNDDEIEYETRREFKTLRENIFVNGKFGEAAIIRASDVVPTAKVYVPNFSALQQLLNHVKIEAVYEEQKYIPYLDQSLPLIGQPGVKSAGKIGTGITVAILDTAILPYKFNCRAPNEINSLPLIGTSGCKVPIYNYFGPTVPYQDQWVNIEHGSLVTGIVEGVAPGAKLAFLQVFYMVSGELTSNWDTMSRAIEWVIANAKTYNIKAANFSLGTTAPTFSAYCPSSRFATYFDRLRNVGVIPVAAAGNEGDKKNLPEPACVSTAVSVGAVYDQNFSNLMGLVGDTCRSQGTYYSVKTYDVACFSNSNSTVKLLAPGDWIAARGMGSFGTSFAAPHVSGAIAVLRASNTFANESLDTTVLRMTATGKKLTDKWSNVTTPFLDLGAAISYIPVSSPSSFPSESVQSIINSILITE